MLFLLCGECYSYCAKDVIPIMRRMLFLLCGGCYSYCAEDVIPIVRWMLFPIMQRMLFPSCGGCYSRPDKATYRSSMLELFKSLCLFGTLYLSWFNLSSPTKFKNTFFQIANLIFLTIFANFQQNSIIFKTFSGSKFQI